MKNPADRLLLRWLMVLAWPQEQAARIRTFLSGRPGAVRKTGALAVAVLTAAATIIVHLIRWQASQGAAQSLHENPAVFVVAGAVAWGAVVYLVAYLAQPRAAVILASARRRAAIRRGSGRKPAPQAMYAAAPLLAAAVTTAQDKQIGTLFAVGVFALAGLLILWALIKFGFGSN
jgi:hypothetical protein